MGQPNLNYKENRGYTRLWLSNNAVVKCQHFFLQNLKSFKMFEQKPNLFYHYCDAIIQKDVLNQLEVF